MDWPAAPLPRMSTSYCFGKMSLELVEKSQKYSTHGLGHGGWLPYSWAGRKPREGQRRTRDLVSV